MPNFAYVAMDASGKRAKGRMAAINDIDLELRLKRMGLDLVVFRPVRLPASFVRTKAGLRELALFCFEMEQLIQAGMPLLQALAEIGNSMANAALREAVNQIAAAVESGQTLSQSMTQHPHLFQPVFVSLVQTGERTGKLAEIFEQLGNTLQWQDEMQAQTRQALAYPAFILVVVLASAAFLVTYLVPQMTVLLQNMGQTIPVQTRFILCLSSNLMQWWWAYFALAVSLYGLAALGIRRIPEMRRHYDMLKLHLPVTGKIVHKTIMARFTRYLALMYQAGIPVLDALAASREIVGNAVVADRLQLAWEDIHAGETMSTCFARLEIFPALVVRMVRIGETTGGLDTALLKAAEFYDRDVRNSIAAMLKMLEPALTILLGGLLALVMFSVLGPVYDAMTSLRL